MKLNEGSYKRATVNMNVGIRKGGRNAVKMSIEELRKEIEHIFKNYCIEHDIDVSSNSYRKFSINNFVYLCCRDRKENAKDRNLKYFHNDVWECKYKFNSENCDSVGDIKMSKKGVPYVQVSVGGDWESPVYFYIYYDGYKLRGYVPLKGNAINRDTNTAFGNNEEADEKFIRKELGIGKNDEFPFNNCEAHYNKEACMEDFMSRLEIKGIYKKKDYSKDDAKFDEFKNNKKRKRKEREKESRMEEVCLNESQLRKVIKETITNILTEAKSIKSQKLQDIFKQHGGIYKDAYKRGGHWSTYVNSDFHNMTDDCILGVMTGEQINQLQRGHTADHWRWSDNYGLDKWAKERGIPMERGDRIETLKLGDGMFLVYIERNAEFEHSGREGGYKDFFNKKEARRRNHYNDGKNEYVPTTNKSKAAQDILKNPYFWAAKNGTLNDRNSGWNDPAWRAEAMNNARNGKDAWGYDALDHYKK